jgi:hypothetical protein
MDHWQINYPVRDRVSFVNRADQLELRGLFVGSPG